MNHPIIPNPLASFEQSLRYRHLDLPELDDFELWREAKRIETALTWWSRRDESGLDWLLTRRVQIRRERDRRAREQTYAR